MQIFSILAFLSGSDRPWRRASASWHLLPAVLCALLLGGLLPTSTQAQEESPIRATDLYRMHQVQEVTISPSGRFAAYTVRSVARDSRRGGTETATHRTQLWVVPATGGEAPRVLTRDPAGARQPAWHPDGSHVAFVRPVDGTPQVFIVSVNGGEPYQLTHTTHGAQHPQWSPNGDHLLYATAVPEKMVQRQTGLPAPSERPGRASDDLLLPPSTETMLVLRDTQTLDPVDTLSLGSEETVRIRSDTTRALRLSRSSPARDSLVQRLTGRLSTLSPDSLHAVLDSLHLRPDTTTITTQPDTTAAPNGNRLRMRRWLDQNREANTAMVSSRLDLQGEKALAPTPTYRHYYIVDVPTGIDVGTPPHPTPRRVTQGYRSFSGAQWLPGSSQIVMSGTPQTDRHPDRVRQRNLYVADLNRNRIQRLLRINGHALRAPTLTSDGTLVAFRIQSLSDTTDDQAEVGLFSLDGRSEPRVISSTLDRETGSLRWSPDGWYLYTTAPSRGGVPVYRFSPFSPDTSEAPSMPAEQSASRDSFALDSTMIRPAPYRQMTSETRAVHEFDVTAATAVYAATDAQTPSALFTNTVSFGNERRLSSHNAQWLSERRLSTPDRVTASSDTLDVDGWATRPSTGGDTRPAPMLVQVRGGPGELDALHTPEAWFERQYLAAQGIGVIEVLPRGSVGYGTGFRRANHQNWGPGPAQDVLAVADSAAALPWTDASQQALSGTSYGATAATWLLGQTDRFEAAVALNGIYDLSAFLDGGRAWRVLPQEFGTSPEALWQDAPTPPTDPPVFSAGLRPSPSSVSPWTALHQNSPATYAHQIDTPLLLLQGDADRRVGPSQAERLYKRLKILNRPAEYVEYPGVGHDVSATATPMQRLDRLVRSYEFLTRFFSSSDGPADETAETTELQ